MATFRIAAHSWGLRCVNVLCVRVGEDDVECTLLHLLCDIQEKQRVMYMMQLHGHIQEITMFCSTRLYICIVLYHTH